MTIKKTLFAAVLALGFMNASAQEQETVEVFTPHRYLQAQVGPQYTVGELSFGKLLSPNVQLGAGYNFTQNFGLRGSLNFWQSKAGSTIENVEYKWKWNYINPAIDATFDLTNIIGGYNPNRPISAGVLVGVGANIAFSNGEAEKVNSALNTKYQGIKPNGDQWLRYLWDGTAFRLTARVGAYADYKVSDKLSLGLEAQYNFVNDKYNSKRAANADGYINLLVGVKYTLGPTHSTKKVKGCEPVVVEKIVEKIVEKPVEKVSPVQPTTANTNAAYDMDPLHEVVYYQIRVTDPKADDVINKVLEWAKKYPKRGISVRGYADKGTGNPRINQNYAKQRADKVASKLMQRGIDKSRLSVSGYGDTVQPFEENDKNRCVIIVGE